MCDLARSVLILCCVISQASAGPLDTIVNAFQRRDMETAANAVDDMPRAFTTEERDRLNGVLKQHSPQGDWIPFLTAVADKNGWDAELLFMSAQAHWRAGDTESAIRISGEAIEAAPNDVSLLYRCAAIAKTIGEFEEARRRIGRTLERRPGHPDALFLLGAIHAEEGDDALAREAFLRVLKDNPGHLRTLCVLGQLETRAGNSEEAVRHLQEAARVYPFFREAYTALRVPLARMKNRKELERVQSILERMQRWTPDSYARLRHSYQNAYSVSLEASAELARELAAVEREDLAKSYLQNLAKANKTNGELKLMLAQLHFNAKELTECLGILEAVPSGEITDTTTFVGLKAWTLFVLKREDECRALYSKHEAQFGETPHFRALSQALAQRPREVAASAEAPPATASIRFADSTEEAGLDTFRHTLGHADKRWIVDAMGSGVAVGDYDNDGDDDIYFVNGQPDVRKIDPAWRNALFRNDGGVFTDVTTQAGVGDSGVGMCAVFGDVDNDGWLDIFVGNYGPNVFYHNNGDGTFTETTKDLGLQHEGYAAAAVFGDVDRDGDLDLFVGNYIDFDPEKHGDLRANYHGQAVMMGPMAFAHQPDLLYLNDGTGRFTETGKQAAVNVSEGRAMGAAFLDIENDGDLDLYVANDSTYNHVLQNDGSAKFEDVSFISGAAICESGRDGASMGVSVGDYNNDGLFDVLVTSYEQEADVLFQNDGEGFFSDRTGPLGLVRPSRWLVTWGSGFCDFDADGLQDIYTVNGHVYPQIEALDFGRTYNQGVSIYRFDAKKYVDVTEWAMPETSARIAGRGSALLDYDGDGDMDIVVNCSDAPPCLLENRSSRGSWLQVKLEGSSAQTLGVRVVARKGDRSWSRVVDGGSGYLSQNSQILHFGFGDLDQIDDVTVHWFHSTPQVIPSPDLNRRLVVDAPGAGS